MENIRNNREINKMKSEFFHMIITINKSFIELIKNGKKRKKRLRQRRHKSLLL